MATSTAPIATETNLTGVLTSNLTSTGLSFTAIFRDVVTGLARTPDSGTLVFTIDKDNSVSETILATSHSTASGVTTVTIASNGRALPKYGAGAGSGTGSAHNAGAEVGCANIAFPLNKAKTVLDEKLNLDGTNSMTSGLPLAQLTTAQRTALTPANGWMVYDTTIGEAYQYIAGSWNPVAAGSTQANASETVAGKVELATAGEIAAGTSTGGTGARLVPPNDSLYTYLATVLSPAGSIKMYGGAAAPTGYLLCDGTSYLRTDYAALFAVLGTTFGSVDGTHFNVPDMRGRAPIGVGTGTGGGAAGTGAPTGGAALTARALGAWKGEETHTLTVTELATHFHTQKARDGGGTYEPECSTSGTGTDGALGAVGFDGDKAVGPITTATQGDSTAHENMQPVMTLNFIIKY